MRHLFATAGATLLLASPASAAYAPKLQVQITPTTFAKAPAVTSTITQASGETASRTVKVTFPKGFEANFGAKPSICSPAQEQELNCPPESQIGTGEAVASVLGLPQELKGTVHYGGPAGTGKFKLIVILRNSLIGDQKIIGTATLLPAGGSEVLFDGLPDVLTTSFKLALEGDTKGLLKNPNTCGTYDITAAFTSQQGEKASGSSPVEITGCKPLPFTVGEVTLNRAGTVSFDLSQAGTGTVTIKRGGKRVATKAFTARKGTNRVRTRALKPGRYVVAISAKSATGQTLAKRLNRTVSRG